MNCSPNDWTCIRGQYEGNAIIKITLVVISFLQISVSTGWTQTKITMDLSEPGADVSSTMYGVFFEGINFGADGGLYSELIKNHSFEFPESMMGWSKLQRRG